VIPLQRFLRYLLGAFTDPITADASSSRIAGFACLIVGCVIAVKHPEHSGTVAALIGGGAVSFLARTKSDSGL
jgi:hypothetical protein